MVAVVFFCKETSYNLVCRGKVVEVEAEEEAGGRALLLVAGSSSRLTTGGGACGLLMADVVWLKYDKKSYFMHLHRWDENFTSTSKWDFKIKM